MLPPSHREEYFTLIRRQAQEKLLFMEEVPLAKSDLWEKVAAIHMETMTRCLASEESKHLFPLLRNCKVKLACLRAAAHGKRMYENIAKHEATTAEMEDALIAPLPHQEFHRVTHRPRNRSPSPLRGSNWPHSRSPKPCPLGPRGLPGAPCPRGLNGYHNNNINRGRQCTPTVTHAQATQGGSNSRPPDKPTTGVLNNQPPTTGGPSNPPLTRAAPPPQLSPRELASLRALINQNVRVYS